MIGTVFLNTLFLLFPLFLYIFYLICNKTIEKDEKYIFFDLAAVSSFYLCCRFGEFNLSMILLINIPLILSFYEKRKLISFILCILAPLILISNYNFYFSLVYIEYLLIFICCTYTSFNKINIFVLLKLVFSLIFAFFYNASYEIIILSIILYAVFSIVIYFYNRIKKIICMFYSLEELTREKKLYESLFKITHEIKNPLAVCKGYLEMFNVSDKKKANKYINIINQEVDRTLFLLKDFSDISKMKIDKCQMDLTMLIFDVIDEVKILFGNNIKFLYDIIDEEVMINGDYNRLKQVLINIIKNAKESIIKEGSVSLSVKNKKDKYIIYIKDNGVGMDKETLKKIGTVFYTTKKDGTGLGVCLSNEIIRKHDGAIKYISKLNYGTTVRITLPINKI